MKNSLNKVIHQIKFEDRFLIVIYSLFPFLLCTSIFLADLFASIAGLVLIYIFIIKNNFLEFYKDIKKEIYFFVTFLIIILLSLIFSNDFKTSFLPSFFYFRYILFALGFYYLLVNYNFVSKILTVSLLTCFIILMLDSLLQYKTLKNIFDYSIPMVDQVVQAQLNLTSYTKFVSSFFNQEKKLGSFIVRLLPFIIALIISNNMLQKYRFDLIVISLAGINIFYTSERTALFLYIIFCCSYFLIAKRKIFYLVILSSVLILLFINNHGLHEKYILGTLNQLGLTKVVVSYSGEGLLQKSTTNISLENLKYYSEEHENLAYTGLVIFKNNFLFGSGIKSFYLTCDELQTKREENLFMGFYVKESTDESHQETARNKLACSTHPHSTYIQILSDTGLFGFLTIVFAFFYTLLGSINIILKKKYLNNVEIRAYYIMNIGIIINLLPLVPSGSFFNNWICLMIFYPLGYWLYLRKKVIKLL